MSKQAVQIVAVNYYPGTRKIAFVNTYRNNVLSVEQVRHLLLDKGIPVVSVSPDGVVAAITRRDETGIQSIRDDTKDNNLDSLPEFDL